ncbi:MAG TPA: hypothetical protein VKZ82_03615 [Nonomuraea sp.]|uniref:hypothetical protein n=1 Tax=Nonomuraea sp. NPDC049649 TaxID=3155776 RepID=UPI002C5B38CE|nr:hypothetical protein [Nonomuraea sp.]
MKRLVLAWVVTAIAATGAAVAVLGLLGGGLTGTSGRVMTQEEARAALTRVTATPARPPSSPVTKTPGATPSAAPETELIRTVGGTVIASCSGDEVTLRSWSPAQGYSVDSVEPGPGSKAEVEFEPDADDAEDVEVKVGCADGRPVRLHG